MKIKSGFTIIELLIAMTLSSLVIFGLLQAFNNIMNYLKTIQEIQSVNRKSCLLFNQMEQDFMTAFIPPVLKKIEPGKPGENPAQNTPEPPKDDKTKAKEEEERLETLRKCFLADIDDNGLPKRINETRTYLFKSVSFINTNPLQVFRQHRARIVRVMYGLSIDKPRSKGEKICYNLWRRETDNLDNVKCIEDEVGLETKSRATRVRKCLVADGIKDFFIQYVYQGRPKIKKGDKEEEDEDKIEEKVFDMWGDKKETKGTVPNRVNIYITFWDERLEKTVNLQATFPVMSFSLIKEPEPKAAKPADKTAGQPEAAPGTDAAAQTTGQQPGQPMAVSQGPAPDGSAPVQPGGVG